MGLQLAKISMFCLVLMAAYGHAQSGGSSYLLEVSNLQTSDGDYYVVQTRMNKFAKELEKTFLYNFDDPQHTNLEIHHDCDLIIVSGSLQFSSNELLTEANLAALSRAICGGDRSCQATITAMP